MQRRRSTDADNKLTSELKNVDIQFEQLYFTAKTNHMKDPIIPVVLGADDLPIPVRPNSNIARQEGC